MFMDLDFVNDSKIVLRVTGRAIQDRSVADDEHVVHIPTGTCQLGHAISRKDRRNFLLSDLPAT